MADLSIHDTRIWYEDTGPGSTGETIVFSHGLLWSSEMFRAQIDHLRERYRVVAWDHRGQGRSADDERRSIGMELVTDDALALLDALDLETVHFAGLSMGGFVGMRLAARHPARIRSLILLNTTAGPEPREHLPKYKALSFLAKQFGLDLVADRVMPIMFGRATLERDDRAVLRAEWRRRLSQNRRSIWRAVNGVIEREGVEHLLPKIAAPTLVVAGAEDAATPPSRAEHIHANIPRAEFVTIPMAGHSSTVEAPEAVDEAIDAFLASLS